MSISRTVRTLLQLEITVTPGFPSCPATAQACADPPGRAALEGHCNQVRARLAEIDKIALCKIKAISSCSASQHSLEQQGEWIVCGASDLPGKKYLCWGKSTAGSAHATAVYKSHPPCCEVFRNRGTLGLQQGRRTLGRAQEAASSCGQGCQHFQEMALFQGLSSAPGSQSCAVQDLSWEANV